VAESRTIEEIVGAGFGVGSVVPPSPPPQERVRSRATPKSGRREVDEEGL
jgi:hypothetical protein